MPKRLPTQPQKATRPIDDEGEERSNRIVHLTQRFVDGLGPAKARYRITDSRVFGLSVRVECSGNHTWQVRIPSELGSRQIWETIGKVSDISVRAARKRAASKRSIAAEGPNARQALDAHRAHRLPFEVLAEEWMEDVAITKKPGTHSSYREKLDLYILPWFQGKKLKQMDAAAIRNWHEIITEKGVKGVQRESTRQARPAATAADRALGTLTAFFKYAVHKKWIPVSPTRGIPHNGDHRIHRPLDESARRKVGQAIREMMLDGSANPIYLMAIQFTMVSSLRREAVTTLEWREVNLEGKFIAPVTKNTTQLNPQRLPLGSAGFSILSRIPRIADSPYVFPGKDPKNPMALSTLNAVWSKVRERAGIHGEYPELDRYGNFIEKPAIRVHDLRHTKTAKLAEKFENPMIGVVVGLHTERIIDRYSGPVRKKTAEANEVAESAFAEDLGIDIDPEFHDQGNCAPYPAPDKIQIVIQVGCWPPRGTRKTNEVQKNSPTIAKRRPAKGRYPSDEILQQMILERPLIQVAREIGVSSEALGKWCHKRGMTVQNKTHWAKLKSKRSKEAPCPMKDNAENFQ